MRHLSLITGAQPAGGDVSWYSIPTQGELEEWWEKHDPIKIFRQKLKELGYLPDEAAAQIEAEAQKEFDEAVDFALKSPEPSFESAFEGIYAPEGGK